MSIRWETWPETQRQKTSGSKVIDEDEMARRGCAHPSATAFDCNADCKLHAKVGTSYGIGEIPECDRAAVAGRVRCCCQ
jgi:hypothetical protein